MATRKQTTKPSVQQPRSAWNEGPWNEIAGLILFGIGLVVMLSLFSYDSADPSWNATGRHANARNWIGPAGAKIADLLFQAFGLAAMFVPFTLFLAGWWQWQDQRTEVPTTKAMGIILMLIAMTGILTMISSGDPSSFYLGGFVGQWLVYGPGIGLESFLGSIGAIVALLILFIAGLVIGTQFSIVQAIVMLSSSQQQAGLLTSVGNRYRLWRQERYNFRGRPETPESMSDKQRQPNRPPLVSKPVINQVEDDEAPAKTKAVPLVSEPELSPDLDDGFENKDGSSIESPAEKSVKPPATPVSAVTASRSTLKNGSPAATHSGSTARTSRRSGSQEDDYYDDGGQPGDDFSQTPPVPQRSVEEMMATASVKRPDHPEELEEKPKAKTISKVKRAVTTVSRTPTDYKLPSTEMLTPPSPRSEMEETELLERARQLAEKCAEFNVSGQVKQISPGPVVTTFEFKPDPGVKYSRVTSLVDDLCLALRAESIRIDRIPGKSTVGIEVPNLNREVIRLREVIESKKFRESESKLTLALGKTIDGSNYVANLTRMPHLLIAGATGAGKSVLLNIMILSILNKATPDEVKMILVDPKRLELGLYSDIPHLLTPIVTDPKRAGYALKWAVGEMESRYKHLAAFGVRNVDQYNNEICATVDRNLAGENTELPRPLPYIVVVIDELADLMMISARDVEESITRLAQMARAVGIHLVLATQRPSVDVITGLIKANFPSRISFRVSSKVDSRTIIDTNGAEALLGSGDMLFLPPGTSRLVRVHGAYVDEKEVKRICDFIRSQGNPAYDEKIVMSDKEAEGAEPGDLSKDEKYDDAVRIVVQSGKASTSLLQRHLRIGYGRAASIIDMMHREGIVGPEDGSKPRQVLVKADFLERLNQIREETDL
jgi:DNA segregation ATPase FtsK/SpoIIIE, S-DNA-T family